MAPVDPPRSCEVSGGSLSIESGKKCSNTYSSSSSGIARAGAENESTRAPDLARYKEFLAGPSKAPHASLLERHGEQLVAQAPTGRGVKHRPSQEPDTQRRSHMEMENECIYMMPPCLIIYTLGDTLAVALW